MEIITGVHVIPSPIVNFYLIVDGDGLTLIDTGLPGNDQRILKTITGIGRKPEDLKRIVITHADGEHIAIAAGRSARELKTRGVLKMLMKLVAALFKAKPAQVDEILAEGQTLPVLGGLRVVETPGHTPGHLLLFLPSSGVLFGGDSMVSGKGGLRVSRGYNTWDEEKAKASALKQAALGARIGCVGHGPGGREAAG